jgi:hypothetical protein
MMEKETPSSDKNVGLLCLMALAFMTGLKKNHGIVLISCNLLSYPPSRPKFSWRDSLGETVT